MAAGVIAPAGGDQLHNNMAPSLAVLWMLAITPVAPPLGSLVYYAKDLVHFEPGEMRAVGQTQADGLEGFGA